jgi:hypothetical protein
VVTLDLWIGGIILALAFWFLLLSFPRSFGALMIIVLSFVPGERVYLWLGFNMKDGNGAPVFIIVYLFLLFFALWLDIRSIRHDGWWFRKW